jgi:16S rRNA (guanine966-N2)-methyltransferase
MMGLKKSFPVEVVGRRQFHLGVSYEFRFAAGATGAVTDCVMRISGGAARGIPLLVPKGTAVRPATDGMRQAVFSSLGARVAGARFLDLFAGSGAYGLEALSRGESGGVFVEQNAKAAACVRQNIASVCKSLGRRTADLVVVQADARTVALGATAELPDLVFVDPPYEIIPEIAPALFARLAEMLATKPDTIVVFELPGELELAPAGWTLLKRLGKGVRQPTVAFFRREKVLAPEAS